MIDLLKLKRDNIYDVRLTDPGAGVQYFSTYKIPDDRYIYIPILICFDLVSSAVAGTRHGLVQVRYKISNSSKVTYSFLDELGFTGTSFTCNYYISPWSIFSYENGGISSTGGTRNAHFPLQLLTGGDLIYIGMNTVVDTGDYLQEGFIRFVRTKDHV